MKLSEIGNIMVLKPSITVKDFFNSVIVFNIYRLNEKNIQNFVEKRNEIIFNGNSVVFDQSNAENNEEINAINEILLCAKEKKLYCIQVGNDSENNEYVSHIMNEGKNKVTILFYEYGIVTGMIQRYSGKVIYSCTQNDEEDNSLFQKIFFYMEEEDKIKNFENEMQQYFVEEKENEIQDNEEMMEEEENELS